MKRKGKKKIDECDPSGSRMKVDYVKGNDETVGSRVKKENRVLTTLFETTEPGFQPNVNCRVDSFGSLVMSPDLIYPLHKSQVKWVLGLPSTGKKLPTKFRDDEAARVFAPVWAKYGHTTKSNARYIAMPKLQDWLESNLELDDEAEFKVMFLAAAVCLVLCPTSCKRLGKDLFPLVSVAHERGAYDWAAFVLQHLIASAKSFASRFYPACFTEGVGGCTFFLAIFYLDRLNNNPVEWGVHPRIKVWNKKHLNEVKWSDVTNVEFGTIGCVDVAYGERHPCEARDTNGPDALVDKSVVDDVVWFECGDEEVVVRKRRRKGPTDLSHLRARKKGKKGGSGVKISEVEKETVNDEGNFDEVFEQNYDANVEQNVPEDVDQKGNDEDEEKYEEDEENFNEQDIENVNAEVENIVSEVHENVSDNEIRYEMWKEGEHVGEVSVVNNSPFIFEDISAGNECSCEGRNEEDVEKTEVRIDTNNGGKSLENEVKCVTEMDVREGNGSDSVGEHEVDLNNADVPAEAKGKGKEIGSFGVESKSGEEDRSSCSVGSEFNQQLEDAVTTASGGYANLDTTIVQLPDLGQTKYARGTKPVSKMLDKDIEYNGFPPRKNSHLKGKLIEFVRTVGAVLVDEAKLPEAQRTERDIEIFCCGGMYGGVLDCYSVISEHYRGVNDNYVRVAAKLYNKVWHKFFGTKSVRYMLDPQYASCILRSKGDCKGWTDCIRLAQSWVKHLPSVSALRFQVIFVPVLERSHWWAVGVSIKTEEVWVIDSLKRKPLDYHRAMIEKVCDGVDIFLNVIDVRWELGTIKRWDKKEVVMELQEDGNSCGVRMLLAIKGCAQRFTTNFMLRGSIQDEREWLLNSDILCEVNSKHLFLKSKLKTWFAKEVNSSERS
ncbi:Ubiquitin-like-specific protease 1A [Bienertia sinuspersici]